MDAITFRELLPQDAQWAVPVMAASGQMGCEYSYTTAFMWSRYYDVTIAQVGDAVILRSDVDGSPSFLLPVGVPPAEGMALLERYCAVQGVPLRLHGVDEESVRWLTERYEGRIRVRTHPEDYDYLYDTQALATLPGNAYHGKKNHISSFSRQYDWRYEPIDDSNVNDVVDLSRQWCAEKGGCEDAGLESERCAIRRLLQHREVLSVSGGLIRVDDKAVAFALGSPINDTVFDIHVEKALSAYSGAYAVINREFAKTLLAYRYLNRENDMGIEGLRRAKQSYRPAILHKKYSCEVE